MSHTGNFSHYLEMSCVRCFVLLKQLFSLNCPLENHLLKLFMCNLV